MFEICYDPRAVPGEDGGYLYFAADKPQLLLMIRGGEQNGFYLPPRMDMDHEDFTFIGRLNGKNFWAGFADPSLEYTPGNILPHGHIEPEMWSEAEGSFAALTLREGHLILDDDLFQAAARASQIVWWRRRTRFCGTCGTEMKAHGEELAMVCPDCGEHYYPHISPAVIVSIEWDGKILMVKNRRHHGKHYGLVAGYVEAGESLEEAVYREVMEETSLRIKNLRYARSQSWPFPNSHMVAFTADYAGGELKLQEEELSDGQWFAPDEIPPLPPRFSVARKLIDEFIERQGGK